MDYQIYFPYKESADISPILCGHSYCKSLYCYGPKTRGFYLIHFINNGKGVFDNSRQKFALKKDDIFLICPEDKVSYSADKDNPWEYTWIGFNGKLADSLLNSVGLSREIPIAKHEFFIDMFHDLKEKILSTKILPDKSGELYLTSLLYLFFSKFPHIKETKSKSKRYVEQIKTYINVYIATPLSVERISKILGLDRRYLSRIFKKHTGQTIQEYIINNKMESAKYLLESTSLSISEIASSISYNDLFHFSKMFKKTLGLSPTSYRKSNFIQHNEKH